MSFFEKKDQKTSAPLSRSSDPAHAEEPTFFGPFFQKRTAFFLSSGLGVGTFPIAPGTAGSLLGLAIGIALYQASLFALIAGLGFTAVAGFWSIPIAVPDANEDPGWVVIDEIAGQMVALLAVPRLSWPWLAASFALFRLFDITKAGPIGWADRKPGAFGIMTDDLLAGGATALVLLLARLLLGPAA